MAVLRFSIVSYVQLLSICCCFFLVFGHKVRELTTAELQSIGRSIDKDFIAVFFDRPVSGKTNPKFLKEFEKSSKVLQPCGFELAIVNCEGRSITQCTSKEQKISVYRKGDSNVREELPISHMFNEDSIVANLLQISLSEDFQYIPDEQSFTELLSDGIGKKDVVFCFVKALGTKAHRHFLELVLRSKNEALFALTTDGDVAKKFGLHTDRDASVFLFHCKEERRAGSECRATQYRGKIDKTHLVRFVKSQMLPKYVVLPSDRSTVYDTLSVPVNKVFVFSDKISDLQTEELEQMAVDMQGSVGIILVDVNEHKDMLPSFGLAKDGNFPKAAFVPTISRKKNVMYVELYPEAAVVFSISNLKGFIKPLVEDPTEEYYRLAESSSLQKLSYAEYVDAMKNMDTNYLLANEFLLAVFCHEDHEPCKTFASTYRRIVRTLDRQGEFRITVAHIKTALYNKKFEGETFPVIRLHLTKSPTEYIQYADILDYENLMDFIVVHTGVSRPVSLPPSLSDLPPISIKVADEETTDFSVEGSEETESGSYTTDETELPAEETEDDEVAAAVLQAPPTVVPEDLVPTLTDKTFDVTKETNDLLVVDFYQPWDPRCRAFLKPYVDTAASLGGLDVGDFSIKLARVNCFDWNDVCEKNNITRYPTIKMFRRGSNEVTYKGPLDSDHLTKAVLMFQPSVPLALASKPEVDMFLSGKLPKLADKATHFAVLGMFPDTNDKGFKAFESSAMTLHSKYLLGYVTGTTAKTMAADYGLTLPSLVMFKRNDPNQPMVVFSNQFTSQNIVDFVHLSSVPSFGELTPFNLPTYLAHQRPLLILFKANNEESAITPVMTKLARDRALPSVFLCWMPVYSESDVNAEILETYTGSKSALPAVVLLNHDKGTVYQFKEEVTKPAVMTWVENSLSGREQPSSLLKEGKWKPLLEGYDFLRMIDEEEEEEERKRLKKHKLEAALNLEEEDESSESSGTENNDQKKTGLPRRPEVRSTSRDEL